MYPLASQKADVMTIPVFGAPSLEFLLSYDPKRSGTTARTMILLKILPRE